MEPIDLTAWRASRQQTITLSCGLTVQVRKVALLDLAAQGNVPVPLHAAVQALIDRQGSTPVDVASLSDQAAVIDLVVKAAVIAPLITDEPTETSISLREIPLVDRIEIFSWAQQEGAALATFPEPAARRDRATRRRERVPLPTE